VRQIVLDTETTGLETQHGHRVIEIGCVELVDRRITGNDYHVYLNPEREIDAGAEAVHGLSTEFLKSKPLFAEVVEAFLDYVDGAELIIHNAPFDVGFINYELKLLEKTYTPLEARCNVLDTLPLARQMHPGQRNSLDALCKRYSVDNSKRDLHGALLDAQLLADVYLAMTGGQSTLFAEDKKSSDDKEIEIKPINQNLNLIVQKASAEENNLHEAYLDKMAKNNSEVIWRK